MRRARLALLFVCAAAASSAAATPPRLSLGLAQAETMALERSPLIKAAGSDLASAQAEVEAGLSVLAPRVTLEGSYQYQTEVPKVSLAPGAAPFQFGAHDNYSVGPALSYTLWDQGALLSAWRSQKALAGSREAQLELVRRQVLLLVRLDYFQVQLALERERSLADSLRLALVQYRDISQRFRAGAASRVDWLSAHEQVLERSRDLRQAQADAAAALRALFALTGGGSGLDVSAPVDERIADWESLGLSSATASVGLEALESVEQRLKIAADSPLDEAYPQLRVYEKQEEAQRLSARGAAAGRWPRLRLSFKSAYFYPDLPLLQGAWQNAAGLAASVPLFEWGLSRHEAQAQNRLADESAWRREQVLEELERDWLAARDRYAALRYEERLDDESVQETAEIARLRYASYRAGGSTILDVESANLGAVEARVAAARRRTELLVQLATLASLSSQGGKP
ncbi:MAG: TolC family protein [Elusimicrobia bacterium]|nr:TolC family protein [Elusimicrobiota bacterium]MDE2426803.1 TolC family protein [Elusimicrobiota bacterium]